jgi:hypothetical protein
MTLVDPSADDAHHANRTANGNGHAAHKPSEVTITRRLFRSGESEYLIDGKTARLRDIQDLFIGTGLGPESYAIIEQGRIGQILSNKPQDRRAIIEEAAGIGKFKTKKRLAEAKLEGAKQNLSRVFDILEEVGRQVNSLKRQASKAKRYEELKTEMIAHLRGSLTARYRMLERDAAKTALDLNLANAEFQNLSTQVTEREREHTALQEACYRNDAELAEARRRLADFQLEQERTRGRLDSQAQQIGAMEQRLGQGETESQELEKRHEQLRQELEAHLRVGGRIGGGNPGGARAIVGQGGRARTDSTGLQQRAKTLETGRQNVLRLLGESSALKNQLVQIGEYLQPSIAMRRAASGMSKRPGRSGAARGGEGGIVARMSAGQMELESTADKRRRVEEELAVRKTQAGEARKLLDQLRTDASRLKARKDSLEEILSHRAYTAESVKRLFTAIERGEAEEFHAAGVLADFVEVEPAYEKATEDFLHEELEYVVVENWNDAERGIDIMRTDLDGRATFLVHPESGEQARGLDDSVGRRRRDRAAERSSAVHQRLCERAARFAASAGALFSGERSPGGAAAGDRASGVFLPAAGWRQLSRACGERRQEDGQRSAGAEARTARTDRRSASEAARGGRHGDGAGAIGTRDRGVQRGSGEPAVVATEARRRRRWRWITSIGSWPRSSRGRSRDCRWRDWNWSGCGRKAAGRGSSRSAISNCWMNGKPRGRWKSRCWNNRARISKSCNRRRTSREKSTARCGRNWLNLKSGSVPSAPRRRGMKRDRGGGGAAAEIAAEMERLGVERARLLSDNIELDRRAGELLEVILAPKKCGAVGCAGDRATRRSRGAR